MRRSSRMRGEFWVFAGLIPFFLVVGVIYGYFTHWEEPTGVFGLLVTGAMCAFVAFFILITAAKIDDRPEDNPFGEQYDVEGEYGFYSPHSWAPLWLAAALALMCFGFAVGWWLFLVSIPFVAIASVMWVFEYWHGEHSL